MHPTEKRNNQMILRLLAAVPKDIKLPEKSEAQVVRDTGAAN